MEEKLFSIPQWNAEKLNGSSCAVLSAKKIKTLFELFRLTVRTNLLYTEDELIYKRKHMISTISRAIEQEDKVYS